MQSLHKHGINFPLSPDHRDFQSNVRSFNYLVAGSSGDNLSSQEIFDKLRNMHLHKQQQWGPVYNIINELRADVAKKQQIITCLGLRHVLEMLPDKTEIVRHFTNPTPQGATGHWKMTWQFAVERELVLLLYEQLHTLNTSSPGTLTLPHPPSIPGSENLRRLISFDFGEWCRRSRSKLISNVVSITQEYQRLETSVAATPVHLPSNILYNTGSAPRGDPPRTILTPLFTNTMGLQYDKWNCYQRGLGLYSELSSSIHKYNKQFEVDETNWDRSDFLILEWLKPDVEEDGRVDWQDARVKRSLPFTP